MSPFDRVDALCAQLDTLRPLDPADVGRAMQRLRLEWTYHSNAIEGNSLTYGETVALLLHGVTAQGKPLKDHLDIRGHREALDYLEGFVQEKEPLTLAAVRELHAVLLGEPYEMWAETPDGLRVKRTITPGQFKTQPNHVLTATGETHDYARPDEVEPRMQALVDAMESAWPDLDTGTVHPVAFAASVHHEVAAIHPFDDGNGRMARLLMNLVLMRAGYVPAVIRQERRPSYYGALATADVGDLGPFEQFVSDELSETMELYLRALCNEPDPDSFSRRVALLKRSVETQAATVTLTTDRRAHLAREFVLPLIDETTSRVDALQPLFQRVDTSLLVYHVAGPVDHSEEARAVLLAGDWTAFQAQWDLFGLRSHPSFGDEITWLGSSRDTAFSLNSTNSLGEQVYNGRLPSREDVAPIVDAEFSALLDRIEAASRTPDA